MLGLLVFQSVASYSCDTWVSVVAAVVLGLGVWALMSA